MHSPQSVSRKALSSLFSRTHLIMDHLSSAQLSSIRLAVQLGQGLSILGALFIIGVWTGFPDLRCYAFKLVLYLTVLDLLHGVWYYLPEDEVLCELQAILTSYFALASIVMTAVIAFALYQSTVRHRDNIEDMDRKFLLITLTLPVIAVVLPLTTSSYGDVGGWCWIKVTDEDYWFATAWRMATFYIPLWVVVLFNSFVYCQVIRKVREEYQQTTSLTQAEGESLLKKLACYPVLLVACYSLMTVTRVLETVHPKRDNFYMMLFGGIAMSLNGLLNAVVYGFTPSVRYRLIGCCFPSRRLSLVYSKQRTDSELI